MKRYLPLLRYARPHWRSLSLILISMMISIGLNVLRPWPLTIFIDYVLGEKSATGLAADTVAIFPGQTSDKRLLAAVVAATVLIALASSVVSYIQTMASVRFNQRVTYDLGADLFEHLQRLSVRYFSARTMGDSIARVTRDPYCVQILITGAVLPVLQSLISLLAMFAIMWRIEPSLTLISLTVVPFQILTIRLLSGSMKSRSRQRIDLETKMMTRVEQVLSVLPIVQAYARERSEVAHFRQEAEETAGAYERATKAELWFGELSRFVTVLGSGAIMLVGGLYALNGQISAGTILVFISYLNSLYEPLNAITYTAATIQAAAANADRALEVLESPPDVVEKTNAVVAPLSGSIAFTDVTFGYDSGRPVLHKVSLEANPGEVVAIVGSSGAGKTSLVNLVPRFLDPWDGRVQIDGHDIRDLSLSSLRGQVAMVMQDPFLLSGTLRENIAFARPEASNEEVIGAAESASAADFIARLPYEYDSRIGERGLRLSGGERQRLSIARAFLKDAPILILDEPTSALDAHTETLLLDALGRLMKNRTTLVIAHRLSTIRNADRILVIEQGRIVEQGRHDELIRRQGPYSRLYLHQLTVANHDDQSEDLPLETVSVDRSLC